MTLWILKQKPVQEGGGWDELHGIVVRVHTAHQARQIAAREAGDEGATIWLRPHTSTCTRLHAEGRVGVIIKDLRYG